MAPRGPTREMLQPSCHVAKVQNSKMLQWYFNGASQLLLQGESYYEEDELITAYVYLKRFLTLAVDMPEHSSWTKPKYTKDRAWLEKERDRIFALLHVISNRLDEADERQAAAAASAERKALPAPSDYWDDLPEAPTGDPRSTPPLLALPPPPPAQEGALLPHNSAPSAPALEGHVTWGGHPANAQHDVEDGTTSVGYDASEMADAYRRLSLEQSEALTSHYPSVGVPESHQERPSMRPGKSVVDIERRVVLPSTLVVEFEKIARPNTNRPPAGIETCGILAGRLNHNVLEMTTLIIPKQKGSSDTCETTDETELFNYMLANKLITLGWIHTHPQQSCFMSSVDVHTHFGYQLMLPEAVAVVYAPCDTTKRIGVFRLTQPEGMKLIQQCKLKGFHVHPDHVTIYEEADLTWSSTPMGVVDLR